MIILVTGIQEVRVRHLSRALDEESRQRHVLQEEQLQNLTDKFGEISATRGLYAREGVQRVDKLEQRVLKLEMGLKNGSNP